jgi:mRNA interferase MazF
VPFPFSDLSRSKLRPAVVLADAGRGDWILCQITSKPYADPRAVPFDNADFRTGSLQLKSYARPGKPFTANQQLIVSQAGQLAAASFERVLDAVVALLRRSST